MILHKKDESTNYLNSINQANKVIMNKVNSIFELTSERFKPNQEENPNEIPKKTEPLLDDNMEKRPFKCRSCGKSFVFKQHLDVHKRLHKRKNTFKCTKMSNKQKSLLENQLCVNGTERPFKCQECGKTFAKKNSLFRHERLHRGEKPFKCDNCNYAFSMKHHLIRHMRLHTNERPFKCLKCEKTFIRKDYLKNHMKDCLIKNE